MNRQNNRLSNRSKIILETSIDGFCVLSLDGKLLEVNSSLCDITGYSKEELLRMKITDIEASETPEQTAQHIEELTRQGYDRFETKHRRKDGKIINIEISSKYCDFGDDKFFFSFFRDITEYKKAQNSLKISESRFRNLADAAFEGIAIHENRKVLDVNQRFIDMFGYTLEELGDLDGIELTAPDCRETVKKHVDTGTEGPYETVGLKKDGSTFPIEVQARQMESDGHIFRVAAVRDLSVKKELEAERERYKENLLKAQRHAYIGSMGAIVAHQVNQPLTKLNILLDRAIERIEEEQACSESSLNDIREGLAEAKSAALIVRKFRQYSKVSSLESMGRINVSTIAGKIVSALSEKAEHAKMRIFIEGLGDLPEVEINETALEQIFLIIMQNAIEAADGLKAHELNVTGKYTDDKIELQFADDCCGVAPENLERIFEAFFTTKAEDQGMGLGLDIVQQILISCSGQIRVESEPGKGATFYITLPISDTLGS